ncbi:MAG: hypothetical protein DME02_15915 [Candidatus Rokuibacteriota bacterium]|nr:MAG: hypothetical protein DME02_15915 [Candidatus Rokubacteria bacterium]
MNRRLWICLVMLTLVAAGFAGHASAQKPIKIGVLTPLSPPGDAGAGQLIVRGAKMAVEEINGRGGVLGSRKVEAVIEDDGGTPEKGVAGLRKLASQDQVVAVVGQFHSSVMTAVQQVAEQFKVPVFATQASAREITERHLNYTFRTHVIDADRVTIWNRWIKERGFKRVAMTAENTDYGVGLVEETKKQFKTMDVKAELKTVMFDRTAVDLTPQLLEIKNWKPDLFINGGIGTPVYLTLKQAYDDDEAAAAWRGVPQALHGGVQGGAGLRRAELVRAGRGHRRRAEHGQERPHRRPREGAAQRQIRGLERHHHVPARRRTVLAAVVAADADDPVHEGGAGVRRGEDRRAGRVQDRRLGAPAAVGPWTRSSSPSTCSPAS